MPIYEYQCGHCGHQLEQLQKMGEAPLTDCPECDKAQLVKIISAAGFQLKGTGWYVTDFKNKGKPPKAETGDTKKTDAVTSSTAPANKES